MCPLTIFMVYIEKKKIKGKPYYYLSENIRIGMDKWKKIRIYLGSGELSKSQLEKLKQNRLPELRKRAEELLKKLPKKEAVLLSKDQIKTLERIKKNYNKYLSKLSQPDIEKFEEYVLTSFTYNTNAIEGSTLSLQDVGLILYERATPEGKDLREIYGAENMKKAYNYIKKMKKLSEKRIKELHKIVMEDILPIELGKYRSVRVFIRGSETKPPEPALVKSQMRSLLAWYSANKDKLHPFELACRFHIRFEEIHPFRDGNGRVGRLLLNYMLFKSAFPLLDIKFKQRSKYFDTLETAHVKHKLKPFINFALQTYTIDAKDRGWLK